MTVRRKTLLIIAITCFGLIVVLYVASRSFLLGSFVKLEQTNAQENVQRVLNALDQDLGAVNRFTLDRASTVDTYRAMPHPTPEFIHSLMGSDASGSPQTRRFNFVLLMDQAGQMVASRGYDLRTKQIIDVPASLTAHLQLNNFLFRSAATNGNSTGLLLLPEGALLMEKRGSKRAESVGPGSELEPNTIRPTLNMG